MFRWHRHHRDVKPKPGTGYAADETLEFTDLEGDFEAERRRALAAEHRPVEPYEHDDRQHPPDGWSGATHP